jgi:hypothetical protein
MFDVVGIGQIMELATITQVVVNTQTMRTSW